MKNELLTTGPFTIYGYGLMIAVGILAAYFTAEYRAKKLEMDYEQIFYLVIWCLAGGFISAKLLFWITEWKSIAGNPAFMLQTMSDGFVVYGGIIGGIFTGYLFCRIKRMNFLKYFDLMVPSIALAQGFGRIGCLLAGCCYGRETDSALSIVFHSSEFAPNETALIPTQIYSSLLDFIHFLILLYIGGKKHWDGQAAACYLMFYSIGRFVLEFFRGDLERGSVGMLSTSQFISIFVAALGIILYFASEKWNTNKKHA